MDFKKHHSVVSNSLRPHGLYSPWSSPGQNTGVGSCSLLQGIFLTQGLNPGLPTLQADSLPAEPPGKPKDTAVDSLSLLQEIFLTQELNWGLLHCRWIFYQLSYQGSSSRHMGETVSSCTFMHLESCWGEEIRCFFFVGYRWADSLGKKLVLQNSSKRSIWMFLVYAEALLAYP